MDDYAGRVLADRYRLPLPPADEYELTDTRAFDTYSGQEVLVRQVPLPEVVEAEVLDAEGLPDGFTARDPRDRGARRSAARTGTRRPTDPAVRRAVEAAQAAARIPDHPRLDQVFDVFAEGGSLWIVSELVAARPLAALLAEKPLTPYRAAEVASDVLMALRVLHAHGWVHRNITARTVLVCDDGRVMLTGLAVGAAEEALCGYDPVPAPEGDGDGGLGGAAGPRVGRFREASKGDRGSLGPREPRAQKAGSAPRAVPVVSVVLIPRRPGVPPSGRVRPGDCRPSGPTRRTGPGRRVPSRPRPSKAAGTSGPRGPARSPRTGRAPGPRPGSRRRSRAGGRHCPAHVPRPRPAPRHRPTVRHRRTLRATVRRARPAPPLPPGG